MTFRILGLDPSPFAHLFGLPDAGLKALGVRRVAVDRSPGFPDRIELRDGAPGETMLLTNYVHQSAPGPYYASHAIFVREGAETPFDTVDDVPTVMRVRPISLRAFNDLGEMIDADLVDGTELASRVDRMLANADVDYLHAHYAKRGCYAARIERA